MGTSGEDAADHPAARTSRSHFEEKANSVSVCAIDHPGKVDTVHCLGKDGIGGALPVNAE
jgi:hypothetical protein